MPDPVPVLGHILTRELTAFYKNIIIRFADTDDSFPRHLQIDRHSRILLRVKPEEGELDLTGHAVGR